jgi:hypothetical protein
MSLRIHTDACFVELRQAPNRSEDCISSALMAHSRRSLKALDTPMRWDLPRIIRVSTTLIHLQARSTYSITRSRMARSKSDGSLLRFRNPRAYRMDSRSIGQDGFGRLFGVELDRSLPSKRGCRCGAELPSSQDFKSYVWRRRFTGFLCHHLGDQRKRPEFLSITHNSG